MGKGQTTNLEEHFRPLVRLPCWGVHWAPHLNLTMNFGAPRLVVREPKRPKKSTGASARIRLQFSHRLVTVQGRWWLWLFWSRWTLSVQGLAPVRSTGSARRIREAIRLLDGQRLTKTLISPDDGRTRFEFDLGAVLDVRELERSDETAIWSLYKPDRRVLSVKGDGSFSLELGSTPERPQRISAANRDAG